MHGVAEAGFVTQTDAHNQHTFNMSAASGAGKRFDMDEAFPPSFVGNVNAILDAVQPFGRSLEHLIQATRISREWRNKRPKEVSNVLDEYFQKVMWSKSEAHVRIANDFNYEIANTDELPSLHDDQVQVISFKTGKHSDNEPSAVQESASDTAAVGGGGGGAKPTDVSDVNVEATVARAIPVRTGCAMEMAATLQFEENMDPEAVAAREKDAQRKHGHVLKPGTIKYGVAKPNTCKPDELLQRAGGWAEDGAFPGVRILNADFAVHPLYENSEQLLKDAAEENDDAEAPVPQTDEEKEAASHIAATLAKKDTTHSSAHSTADHGKRTGTRYSNDMAFPAAMIRPFPHSVVCAADSEDASPEVRCHCFCQPHSLCLQR